MPFGDQLRKNFQHEEKKPRRNLNDVRKQYAETIELVVENDLMYKAKSGISNVKTTGLWGSKIKVVDKYLKISRVPVEDIQEACEEYVYCFTEGLSTDYPSFPNEREFEAVFSILQKLCSSEGINVEVKKDKDSFYQDTYLYFWVQI